MSVAYYIVPERPVPDLDCFVDGKALAHVRDGVIERVCREAKVRPLEDFLSDSPEETAATFEHEGIDLPPDGFPPEQWFAAADGLETVRALLARLGELERKGTRVADDLRNYEEVLVGLERAGVRWHLAVDY